MSNEDSLDDDFLPSSEDGQVWAMHRDTGKMYYIEPDSADRDREYAKKHLRCPMPGCDDVMITLVGGSHRAHFRHMGGNPHKGESESENHLEAKAALKGWVEAQFPDATVSEEYRGLPSRRVPDVAVQFPDSERVRALEPEYEHRMREDAFRAKMADYRADGVRAQWVLGHTRLKTVASRHAGASAGPLTVRVPMAMKAWLRSGQPPVAINPKTLKFGTLVAPDGHRLTEDDDRAKLIVEPMDTARYDRDSGTIITRAWEMSTPRPVPTPPPGSTPAIGTTEILPLRSGVPSAALRRIRRARAAATADADAAMQSRVAVAIRQERAADVALEKAVGAYLDTLTGPARDVLDIGTGEKPRLLADPTLWRSAVVMHLVGGQQGEEHTDAEAVEMLQRLYGVPTLATPGACAAEVGTWIRRADHFLGGGVFTRVRDGAWRNLTG